MNKCKCGYENHSGIPEHDTHSCHLATMEIMRAINKELWWKEMRELMPMVAANLVKAGVKFPKSKPHVKE